jgi:hypothetical protein
MADNFNRQKMLWLNSVFFDPKVRASTCRIAYIIGDHLNRITGDAWPAQSTIARRMGTSSKTVYRGLKELEAKGRLKISRGGRSGTLRYAPVFDIDVPEHGQARPSVPDASVQESYLNNLTKTDLRTGDVEQGAPKYRRAERGRFELEIASRLGAMGVDGMAILSRLAEINDRVVAEMCKLQQSGSLSSLSPGGCTRRAKD